VKIPIGSNLIRFNFCRKTAEMASTALFLKEDEVTSRYEGTRKTLNSF
jgi:hypothetical protein